MPPTASCWPCSASAPRLGKPPRATVSWAGPAHPPAQPAPGRQSRPLSHPALDRLPSLASHLLACLQRQLPDDWQHATAFVRFCSKPSAKRRASRAPATAPPTGSISARPRAVANSILVTSTTSPSKTSSSNPSARTGKQSSIVSSKAAFHGPPERLRKMTQYAQLECG